MTKLKTNLKYDFIFTCSKNTINKLSEKVHRDFHLFTNSFLNKCLPLWVLNKHYHFFDCLRPDFLLIVNDLIKKCNRNNEISLFCFSFSPWVHNPWPCSSENIVIRKGKFPFTVNSRRRLLIKLREKKTHFCGGNFFWVEV